MDKTPQRQLALAILATVLLSAVSLSLVAFTAGLLISPEPETPVNMPVTGAARDPLHSARAAHLPEVTTVETQAGEPESQTLRADPAARAAHSEAKTVTSPARPVEALSIPSLGLETHPISIPVRQGQWDISSMDHETGWLQTTGDHPRDALAMVMIGHVTLPGSGKPGPFYTLPGIKEGEKVHYRAGNRLYTYRVIEKRLVDPEEVESLYIRDGSKLVLVTCNNWNPITRRYAQRLLVEAELEKVELLRQTIE